MPLVGGTTYSITLPAVGYYIVDVMVGSLTTDPSGWSWLRGIFRKPSSGPLEQVGEPAIIYQRNTGGTENMRVSDDGLTILVHSLIPGNGVIHQLIAI